MSTKRFRVMLYANFILFNTILILLHLASFHWYSIFPLAICAFGLSGVPYGIKNNVERNVDSLETKLKDLNLSASLNAFFSARYRFNGDAYFV